jgi:hypothetical protein
MWLHLSPSSWIGFVIIHIRYKYQRKNAIIFGFIQQYALVCFQCADTWAIKDIRGRSNDDL